MKANYSSGLYSQIRFLQAIPTGTVYGGRLQLRVCTERNAHFKDWTSVTISRIATFRGLPSL